MAPSSPSKIQNEKQPCSTQRQLRSARNSSQHRMSHSSGVRKLRNRTVPMDSLRALCTPTPRQKTAANKGKKTQMMDEDDASEAETVKPNHTHSEVPLQNASTPDPEVAKPSQETMTALRHIFAKDTYNAPTIFSLALHAFELTRSKTYTSAEIDCILSELVIDAYNQTKQLAEEESIFDKIPEIANPHIERIEALVIEHKELDKFWDVVALGRVTDLSVELKAEVDWLFNVLLGRAVCVEGRDVGLVF